MDELAEPYRAGLGDFSKLNFKSLANKQNGVKHLRLWMILAGAFILIIVLPIIALTQSGWVQLAGQIVLSIVLILALIGSGLFGYICFRAQAKKWGAGLFVIVVLCIVAIYWLWAGHPPFL